MPNYNQSYLIITNHKYLITTPNYISPFFFRKSPSIFQNLNFNDFTQIPANRTKSLYTCFILYPMGAQIMNTQTIKAFLLSPPKVPILS